MLLVRTVAGPVEALVGTRAIYKATSFNMPDPPIDELRQINWVVKTGDQTVAEFEAQGDTLSFDVPEALAGSTIRVMPFRNSPSRLVSVLSRVVREAGPIDAASKLIVLSRDEWGPRTDIPRLGETVARARRTKVFIHHTDVVDDDATANEWETLDEVKRKMRQLQTIRAKDLGADVPYSMVAFCMTNGDLMLCEGRGIDRSGAHTAGQNTPALGISFQGDFENQPPPKRLDAHLAALSGWLRRLREEEGFVNLGSERPATREVFAHQDVKPTDCPGKHILSRLTQIRFL